MFTAGQTLRVGVFFASTETYFFPRLSIRYLFRPLEIQAQHIRFLKALFNSWRCFQYILYIPLDLK